MLKTLYTDWKRDITLFLLHWQFPENIPIPPLQISSIPAAIQTYGPLIDSLLLAASHIRLAVSMGDGKHWEVYTAASADLMDSTNSIIFSHADTQERRVSLSRNFFSHWAIYCAAHRMAYWIEYFNIHRLVFTSSHLYWGLQLRPPCYVDTDARDVYCWEQLCNINHSAARYRCAGCVMWMWLFWPLLLRRRRK